MPLRGEPTAFRVDRGSESRTVDLVGEVAVEHGEFLTVHWPEQEESRVVFLDKSIDSHGTEHHRAYFVFNHFGTQMRVYLRDISIQISVRRGR